MTGAALGDVIGVAQIIFVIKKSSKCHWGILMSQNFQFMNFNIISINPKAAATIYINKKYLCYPYDVT